MTDPIVWELPRIFAGLLMFSLMLWVLALDWRSRVMRTFAAFMLLRGLLNVLLPFVQEGRQTSEQLGLIKAYSGYLEIAIPFIAIAFAVRLLDPDRPRWRTMGALIASATMLEVLYWWNHDLFWGKEGFMDGMLSVTVGLGTLAYMAIGHILMRRDDQATYIAGVAYTLFPLFAATLEVGIFIARWQNGVLDHSSPRWWVLFAVRLIGLAYGGWLLRRAVRSGPPRRAAATACAMVVSAAAGLVPLVVLGSLGRDYWRLAGVFNGILTALMPIAIGWALTQRALFATPGTLHLRMPHVITLFLLIWATTLASLYLGTLDLHQAAVAVGAFAVSLMVFLLVQSHQLGRGRETSRADAQL